MGEHSYIGPQCILNIDENIVLGNNSGIGPRSMLFTHGSFLPYTSGYKLKFGTIEIGNYVWLPAGVFIHPGVTIGDHVLVNSMSVIRRSIPPGVVADGFPAEKVNETENVRRKLTPEMIDERICDILVKFSEIVLKRGLNIDSKKTSKFSLIFERRKYNYQIQIIPSQENQDMDIEKIKINQTGVKIIYLINKSVNLGTDLIEYPYFNFNTKEMARSNDFIFRELKRFMQRYFGERFKYSTA